VGGFGPPLMLHWTPVTRSWRLAAALVVLFPLASFSTEHHWDEYFYLYSTAHHTLARLLSFEPTLADGVFPNGFFSGKLGFVVLLRGLMMATGGSWTAVPVIRGLFAVLCVLAAACTVGLVRTLMPERRPDLPLVGAVALASPILLYLGFKTLSEVPALLLVTMACWTFASALDRGPLPSARGFAERPSGRPFVERGLPQWLGLGLTVVALALATLTRITALVGFASFVAALPLLADRRYSWRRAWGWAAVVVLAHAVVVFAVYLPLGITPERFRALAQSVTGRSQGAAVTVYALALTVQGLGLLAMIGLRWPMPARQQFALGWAALGSVPYVLSSSYLEPRFFYLTVPALAILACDGLERVKGWTPWPRARNAAQFLTLAALTVVNRAAFVPLMPFELDERPYRETMTALEREHAGGTVLVPWLSDFCYLRLSRPDAPVVLTFSRTYGSGAVFATDAFRAWVGGDSLYAGDAAALASHPTPWKYVGWTYNPSVLRVQDRLAALGLLSRQSPEDMKLLNHLTASWLWANPAFPMTAVPGGGPYQAFLVRSAGGE
jgi:hypothetical protein